MNRLHLHFSVWDLDSSRDFYSRLFCKEPDVLRDDYAKWLVDEPPLNFAISTGAESPGFSHMGIQTDDERGLKDLRRRAAHTGAEGLDEENTRCCYARSDKTWIRDPDGVAWELFQTHEHLQETPQVAKPQACGCQSE